jgi:hypothetical protein
MQPTDTFVPRSRDVASEEFDGEFVVLDLASGKYYGLSGGSAVVWKGLMAGHSVTSLCAQLPDGDPRRAEVATLVGSLLDSGLLVVANGGAVAPPGLAVELAAASGPFAAEMFEDLADLLLTDPIHDVDQETGWPHRPTDD